MSASYAISGACHSVAKASTKAGSLSGRRGGGGWPADVAARYRNSCGEHGANMKVAFIWPLASICSWLHEEISKSEILEMKKMK